MTQKNSSIIFSSKPSCWHARFIIARAVECISSFKFRPVHFQILFSFVQSQFQYSLWDCVFAVAMFSPSRGRSLRTSLIGFL